MTVRACAFTGHRASKLPWRYNENDPRCRELKQRIFDVVEALYTAYGVRKFICGMAEGCDMYFCESVLQLKEMRPDIILEAAIPFAGQADQWPEHQRIRWAQLVAQCDEKTVLRQMYSHTCMMERNKYMVDHAQILVACYDGKSGGTLNTLRYAIKQEREILQIQI